MNFTSDQMSEFSRCFPGASCCEEGDTTYYYIPELVMPVGCTPSKVEALFRPANTDGYPSKLYFSELVKGPTSPNYHIQNQRIFSKNWFSFSWKITVSDSPVKMLHAHLKALTL